MWKKVRFYDCEFDIHTVYMFLIKILIEKQEEKVGSSIVINTKIVWLFKKSY